MSDLMYNLGLATFIPPEGNIRRFGETYKQDMRGKTPEQVKQASKNAIINKNAELKELSRKLILAVLTYDERRASDVARETKLSRATIRRHAEEMMVDGIVFARVVGNAMYVRLKLGYAKAA